MALQARLHLRDAASCGVDVGDDAAFAIEQILACNILQQRIHIHAVRGGLDGDTAGARIGDRGGVHRAAPDLALQCAHAQHAGLEGGVQNRVGDAKLAQGQACRAHRKAAIDAAKRRQIDSRVLPASGVATRRGFGQHRVQVQRLEAGVGLDVGRGVRQIGRAVGGEAVRIDLAGEIPACTLGRGTRLALKRQLHRLESGVVELDVQAELLQRDGLLLGLNHQIAARASIEFARRAPAAQSGLECGDANAFETAARRAALEARFQRKIARKRELARQRAAFQCFATHVEFRPVQPELERLATLRPHHAQLELADGDALVGRVVRETPDLQRRVAELDGAGVRADAQRERLGLERSLAAVVGQLASHRGVDAAGAGRVALVAQVHVGEAHRAGFEVGRDLTRAAQFAFQRGRLEAELHHHLHLGGNVAGDAPGGEFLEEEFTVDAHRVVLDAGAHIRQANATNVELDRLRARDWFGRTGLHQVFDVALPLGVAQQCEPHAAGVHAIHRHLPAQQRQQFNRQLGFVEGGKLVGFAFLAQGDARQAQLQPREDRKSDGPIDGQRAIAILLDPFDRHALVMLGIEIRDEPDGQRHRDKDQRTQCDKCSTDPNGHGWGEFP